MKIILAKPRGFCAGVARAIRCVERVWNSTALPFTSSTISFTTAPWWNPCARAVRYLCAISAKCRRARVSFLARMASHPTAGKQARARDLKIVDATCPLVEKVHREARKFAKNGFSIVLIGERGHNEVVGTTGWAPDHIQVILTEERTWTPSTSRIPGKIVYLTQTTLSIDDCERVVAALRRRFPAIEGPPAKDICYATQNRQQAIAQLAARADIFLVVGDVASANSKRLAEICRKTGKPAYLTPAAADIDEAWPIAETVLVTSGASVPESLVEGVVERLKALRPCEVEECEVVHEDIRFNLPRAIAET